MAEPIEQVALWDEPGRRLGTLRRSPWSVAQQQA